MTNLEMLHLGNNRLSGSLPKELGSLIKLRKFSVGLYDVGSDKFQPPMSNLLNELKPLWEPYGVGVLQQLGAYPPGNQLRGIIPPELGNLNQVEELGLAWNHFNGSIPSELGQLTNIKRLSLSNNQLSGSIPAELGNLTQLEYLDLAWNNLEGYVPESFCQLEVLEKGDFRHNHLAGTTVSSDCEDQPFSMSHNRPKNAIPPLLWVVWGILFCGIVVNLRKSPRSNSR